MHRFDTIHSPAEKASGTMENMSAGTAWTDLKNREIYHEPFDFFAM
jgi:hypothetical protein